MWISATGSFAQAPQAAAVQACPAETGVPSERLKLLARGFNLTGWLDRKPSTPPDRSALRALRARGFTHVRLPVKAEFLSEELTPGPEVESQLGELSRAVDELLGLGYAVTLDMHPGEAIGRLRKQSPERAFAIVEALWRRLAKIYASRAPDRLFFEMLNEPSGESEWQEAVRLAGIVRALAPAHTLVLGPAHDQRIEALEALAPIADRNVVYAIHFYDPMGFTHQGLNWSGPEEPLSQFHDVPFPSSATNPAVQALHAQLLREGRDAADRALAEHMKDPWDEAAVDATFARAAAWASRHRSAVIVNEFGVLSWKAAPRDRARWLRAVRSSAERHCIGWVHWDYADGFGFMRRANGREAPDPNILDALIDPRR